MNVKRVELNPGVSLTTIKTDKFKSGCITVFFLCNIERDTASANALFPKVLRRGSKNYPDLNHISSALDNLYGTRIEPVIRKKGEMHCPGFVIDFPDDRYIKDDQGILEKATQMAFEIIFHPHMKDSLLFDEYVDSEKSNLIDDICAAINDKRGYSIDRLIEEMCSGEPYGVLRLGCADTAASINPGFLTAHYNNVIGSSMIELFYCGSADHERVKDALSEALKNIPSRENATLPHTTILLDPVAEKPRYFSETFDVSQCKLTMGFRIGKTMNNPDYPAMMMFNAIYGGSVTSKLFQNVRERLSLCYYVSSSIDKHKGIMLVSSGIDLENLSATQDEVLLQLGNVKKGEISDDEFDSAKRYLVSAFSSALDKLGTIEDLYFDSVTSAVKYDPIGMGEAVKTVTKDRVIEIASDIRLDSVFFLAGSECENGI